MCGNTARRDLRGDGQVTGRSTLMRSEEEMKSLIIVLLFISMIITGCVKTAGLSKIEKNAHNELIKHNKTIAGFLKNPTTLTIRSSRFELNENDKLIEAKKRIEALEDFPF